MRGLRRRPYFRITSPPVIPSWSPSHPTQGVHPMKRILLSLALATSFVSTAALACDGHDEKQASVEPTKATVADVASWTKAKAAIPVDANGKETRAKNGVIPGAVLLTSSSTYAVSELP